MLVCTAGVRDNVQLDLATKYATIFVDGIGPQLIALLEGFAVCGEVARKR
jgi:hypothetical protein